MQHAHGLHLGCQVNIECYHVEVKSKKKIMLYIPGLLGLNTS